MATMNVSLPDELDEFVRLKVESGMYASNSDVMRDALRLLRLHDQVLTDNIEEIRAKVAIGLEQLKSGQGIDGEQAFSEVLEED